MKSVHSAEMQEKDDMLNAKDEELQAMKEAQVETVKLLYSKGATLEEISKGTKLSADEIKSIINKK